MGELARDDRNAEQVQSWLLHSAAQLTGSVAVFVDETGERSMVSGRGADHFLLPSELPRQVISEAGCLHLTAWSFFTDLPRAAARAATLIARRAGVPISFDPAPFQMIHEAGLNALLSGTPDLGISALLPN